MKPIKNPPNPFASTDRHYFEGMTPPAKIEIYEDATRNILAKNNSPDLGFRWSLNPYRGCVHACAYCYARPSHEYLDFGAGTDFETKIVIKPCAPELLRETFRKRSWKGELIVFSGDTDCYQPLEAHFELTRKCLEVCLEFGNPAGIITKSSLIRRDLELLKALHLRTFLSITISIPFFEDQTARLIEPHAASISARFETLRILSEAGLETGVNIAPVIPGLSDSDIPQILKKAKASGARWAGMMLLRLPGNVKEVFASRIKTLFPLAYEKILGRIRQTRSGALYHSQFGKHIFGEERQVLPEKYSRKKRAVRHSGEGEYWNNIKHTFDVYCKKLGLNKTFAHEDRLPFKCPTAQRELELNLT